MWNFCNDNENLIKKNSLTAPMIKMDDFVSKVSDATKIPVEELKTNPNKAVAQLLNNSVIKRDFSKYRKEFKSSKTSDPSRLEGFCLLDNNFPILGTIITGKNDCIPMYICFYWDGKRLKGYIPKYGNTVNVVMETMIGCEEEYEYVREDEYEKYKEQMAEIDMKKYPDYFAADEINGMAVYNSEETYEFFCKHKGFLEFYLNHSDDEISYAIECLESGFDMSDIDVDSEEFIDYRDCEYDESAHDDVTVEYRIMFCGPGIYGIAYGENAEAGEIRNIDAIKKDIELTIKVV